MSGKLNINNTGFTQYKNHLFVSNDLIMQQNGGITIKKWVSDYEQALPKSIDYHFNPDSGSKSLPWHPFRIHHYIPFSRFTVALEKSELNFPSPIKWLDPYESLFYEENVMIGDEFIDIRCLCTTYESVDGEESAWARGGGINGKMIRVSYKYHELCKVLDRIAQENHCLFFISICDYSQSKDNLQKKNKPCYTSLADYVKTMSLKRKAFTYENELRIFAVFKNTNKLRSPLPVVFSFKLNANDYQNMIATVCLPPLKPFPRDDERNKHYEELQDIENKGIKEKLSILLHGVKIVQSRLYCIG